MEIILKQNVEKLGFKDEIVTVKNGYGRNYLIPKRLGGEWNLPWEKQYIGFFRRQ